MIKRFLVVFALLLLSLISAGCNGGNTGALSPSAIPANDASAKIPELSNNEPKPVDIVHRVLRAYAERDVQTMKDLTCVEMQANLATLARPNTDVSKLKLEEISNDGHIATVRLSGTLLVDGESFDVQSDGFDVKVVNTNGVWRFCDDLNRNSPTAAPPAPPPTKAH
jgi:hypothetical protein